MCNTLYSCQILIKPEFSLHILEKYTNSKFFENRPEGAELFHAYGQTDRHDEANSRFLKFYEPT